MPGRSAAGLGASPSPQVRGEQASRRGRPPGQPWAQSLISFWCRNAFPDFSRRSEGDSKGLASFEALDNGASECRLHRGARC